MKGILQNRGLSFKMILFVGLSALTIFILISRYNYSVSKIMIEKHVKENAKYLTYDVVNRIEKILKAVQKVPDNLSKILETKDFTEEEIIKLLKLVVENNSEIYGSTLAFEPYYFKKNQKYCAPYICFDKGKTALSYLGNDSYDYFTMDWYQIPKEIDAPVWSEPYYDEGGGNILMSTYSVPVHRTINGKKQLIGVLTADISLDMLKIIVSSIKICETGYGFMISKTGRLITHPVDSLVMNYTIFEIADETKAPILKRFGKSMVKGDISIAEVEYKNVTTGKLSWLSYAPISLNGWSVGIIFPVEELMADVTSLNNTVLYFSIGGSFFLLLVVALISGSITKPLRSLTAAAEKFAAGDFKIQLPAIKSKDEIGKLTTAFRYMQNALDSTIINLKETSGQLKVSNTKLEEYSKTLEDKVEERTAELQSKNEELDKSFNNVKILSEIGQKLTSSLNLDLIQHTIYESVNSLLDASVFLIMDYLEKEQILQCKLSIEKSQVLPAYNISMTDKNRFAVWCVDNKKPVFMNDVDTEYIKYIPTRTQPKAGEYVSSLIYIPLIVDEKVIGVLSAQSFKKNAYTPYHFDILNNLAAYAAIALDNANAYAEIKKANQELKEAQKQLIQSEKLASLGQLTAGIAHEIKNPLNFVNNFSVLSVDLIDEFRLIFGKESNKMDPDTVQDIEGIISDLEGNVKKIEEHGKRADSIVRGMLLHSRGKAGEMQPSDINVLLAEYVNLGYHGMRAQDTAFNIKIESDFDNSIGMVRVVPQDLSRVFLNIINNACYSTNLKKKELKDAYVPVLSIKTKNYDDKIEVIIRDNGKGIPKEITDKVFNPFFTTKPAGSGTGLGLSISYDIITQEHKGELKFDTKDGEYAEFTISIPKNL